MGLTFHFNSKEKPQEPTEDMTPDDFNEESFKKIVWCDFTECFWNTEIKGLYKTKGSILKNRNYVPLGKRGYSTLCSRPEIAIQTSSFSVGNSKRNVPTCFTIANNGKTDHMDFSRLLQSDGSPYGGSLESQHPSL